MREMEAGVPSAVTASDALEEDEIRERMSGNLCRCGAYNGIVDAVRLTMHGAEEHGAPRSR
jgi:xanthine dehydrogenase YagT iron-sulfur-binding subunit